MPELHKTWLIPEETHKAIVDGIVNYLGFDRALSYELDNEGKLYARYGRGIDPRSSSYSDGRVPDPGEIFDWAIKEKKEQIVLDPHSDPRCNPEKVRRDNTKPFAVVPVEKDGKVKFLITANNWEKEIPIEMDRIKKFQFITSVTLDAPKIDNLEEGISKIESAFLVSRFVREIKNMKAYLAKIKFICDDFDMLGATEREQIFFINVHKNDFSRRMTEFFDNLWAMAKRFNKEEYAKHQRYYQKMLGELLLEISINKYIYQKPLGYPGDYVMMNYIYDYFDSFLGESTYKKLINYYTCHIPVSRSNIERKTHIKAKIFEVLSQKEGPKIVSVGAGPARELIELLCENKISKPINFVCLDFESQALDFVKNSLARINRIDKSNLNVSFVESNIVDLFRNKEVKGKINQADLIYVLGVFDYLSDRISEKLVSVLFGALKAGGRLLICNANSDKSSLRAYYEMLGEWYLIHRTRDELLRWGDAIREPKKIFFDNPSDNNYYLFLAIDKL